MAGISNCDVLTFTTIGSDHYPVICSIGEGVEVRPANGVSKWVFIKADWAKLKEVSDDTMKMIDLTGDIEDINCQVTNHCSSRESYTQEQK